jgi:hypothetical protein
MVSGARERRNAISPLFWCQCAFAHLWLWPSHHHRTFQSVETISLGKAANHVYQARSAHTKPEMELRKANGSGWRRFVLWGPRARLPRREQPTSQAVGNGCPEGTVATLGSSISELKKRTFWSSDSGILFGFIVLLFLGVAAAIARPHYLEFSS